MDRFAKRENNFENYYFWTKAKPFITLNDWSQYIASCEEMTDLSGNIPYPNGYCFSGKLSKIWTISNDVNSFVDGVYPLRKITESAATPVTEETISYYLLIKSGTATIYPATATIADIRSGTATSADVSIIEGGLLWWIKYDEFRITTSEQSDLVGNFTAYPEDIYVAKYIWGDLNVELWEYIYYFYDYLETLNTEIGKNTDQIASHVNTSTIHVTSSEKTTWNNKVSANDYQINLKVGSGSSAKAFTLNQSTSGVITIPSGTTSAQGVVKVASSISNDSSTVPTNAAVYSAIGDIESALSALL